MSLHEVITLPDSHPEHPALWVSDCQHFRAIRCKDDIQFIVQGWQSPKWRNLSYHCNWTSIATRWLDGEEQGGNPFLSIPVKPPLTVVSAAASDEDEKLAWSLVGGYSSFEITERYWITHGYIANIQHVVGRGKLF